VEFEQLSSWCSAVSPRKPNTFPPLGGLCVHLTLFLPLYIYRCVSAPMYLPLWMCILTRYCISGTVSAAVYLPLYIYLLLYILHCISATVSAVLLRVIEYKERVNYLSYKSDCLPNYLMVESMPLYAQEMVEWRQQWRMAGGEWKFVNESTQMTQCITKHSPMLSISFDSVLKICRSSG